MAVCLDYQSVPYRRTQETSFSWKKQVIAVSILIFALVAHIRTKHLERSYGYVLAEENKRTQILDDERRDLEFQLSALKKHDSLRHEAFKRLGLRDAKSGQIVKIK
jgi:cell division protein FtsL